jgi:hypothetical protein
MWLLLVSRLLKKRYFRFISGWASGAARFLPVIVFM